MTNHLTIIIILIFTNDYDARSLEEYFLKALLQITKKVLNFLRKKFI